MSGGLIRRRRRHSWRPTIRELPLIPKLLAHMVRRQGVDPRRWKGAKSEGKLDLGKDVNRGSVKRPVEQIVKEIDRVLADVTPRAAAVTLMLFDRVVARYEREKGRPLTDSERQTILAILRYIVARESRINNPPCA